MGDGRWKMEDGRWEMEDGRMKISSKKKKIGREISSFQSYLDMYLVFLLLNF